MIVMSLSKEKSGSYLRQMITTLHQEYKKRRMPFFNSFNKKSIFD